MGLISYLFGNSKGNEDVAVEFSFDHEQGHSCWYLHNDQSKSFSLYLRCMLFKPTGIEYIDVKAVVLVAGAFDQNDSFNCFDHVANYLSGFLGFNVTILGARAK